MNIDDQVSSPHDQIVANDRNLTGGMRADVCAALARILHDGIDVHRCMAARALGRMDQPEAVEALVEALLDEDEDVRTDAAGALARLAPPAAGRPLLESLLGDPCTDVKLQAVDALVRLRHPEAVPWLRRVLKGRDEEIAWDESDFYEGGWDDWVDFQVRAVEALAALGVEDSVPEIVAAIDDEFGQDLTETGFKALAKLGEPGVAALAGYMDSADSRRRRRVAAVLAESNAAAAAPALECALRDPSEEVRSAAMSGLVARDPADPRLAAMFSDEAPALRAAAIALCGPWHVTQLTTLLDDPAEVVARAVLDLLAEAPDLLPRDAVIEALHARLSGPDARTAASAAVALAVVAPEAALDELAEQLEDSERPLEVRLGAVKGLGRLDSDAAAQALAAVLGSDPRQVRLEAMAALAAMAVAEPAWPNAAGRTLLAALRGELIPEPPAEPDPVVGDHPEAGTGEAVDAGQETPGVDREVAVEPHFPKSTLQSILGHDAPSVAPASEVGDDVELTQEDLDHLAQAARRTGKKIQPVVPQVAPHQDVRRFAARVLGDLARAEVADELATALTDSDTDVRLAAADSLARIAERLGVLPDEAVDALLRALGEGDRDMRLLIIRALGMVGGEGTAAVLAAQLHDEDSFIRAETVRALSRLGSVGPAVEALLQGDPDPGVRLAAAGAVAGSRAEGTVELLADFAFAFEGYHRRQAGRALRNLDIAAANRRFLEALGDAARTRLWPVAIEALEELNHTDTTVAEGPGSEPYQQEGAGLS